MKIGVIGLGKMGSNAATKCIARCQTNAGHAANEFGQHVEHEGMDGMAATGLLGSYPMTRDSSGTSWQPNEA